VEQAKKELYNLLLHTASTRYGFNTIIKYISQRHKVPYIELKDWVDEQREIIAKEVEDLVYHKVEVHVEDPIEENKDEKYHKIVLDKKATLQKRKDALHRINDDELLIQIYKKLENPVLKIDIIQKHISEVFDLALKEKDEMLRIEAIKGVYSQLKLRWAAEETQNKKIKLEAIKKLKDPHSLQKMVVYEKDIEVRKTALNKITSVMLLKTMKMLVETSFLSHIEDRITNLKGSKDHLNASIETLIKNYS
jgi:hypothetical protein